MESPVRCTVCDDITLSQIQSYMSHYAQHQNPNITFTCPVTKCQAKFAKFVSMKAHVSKCHRHIEKIVVVSSCYKFHCPVFDCHYEADSEPKFLQHINKHLNENMTINCPFNSCPSKYNNQQSFRSHLFRKHKHENLSTISSIYRVSSRKYMVAAPLEAVRSIATCDASFIPDDVVHSSVAHESAHQLNLNDFEIQNDCEDNDDPNQIMLQNLALFFLS